MICEKEKCAGCFACYNICPKNAIEMIEDEYGYIYPKVNREKCIDCNLCKKVCPVLNEIKFNKVKKCYAARVKDSKIYLSTSSGGIASLVSEKIINENGIVYGASINEKNKIAHRRVNNLKDLELLKGSKYVHSYITGCYKNIKIDLLQGKEVLFIGTPCQVQGLKKFLFKDYENLYTIDLICHGVPSQKFLKDDLERYLKNNSHIKYITFRDKGKYCLKLKLDNKTIYKGSKEFGYYTMFLKGQNFRENCYSCSYARIERVGDITLGDFWGLDEVDFEHNKGVNCVLINTSKGEKIFDRIKEEIFFQEKDVELAIKENTQLKSPVKKGNERKEFLQEYLNKGYKKATFKVLGYKWYIKKIFHKVKRVCKYNVERNRNLKDGK